MDGDTKMNFFKPKATKLIVFLLCAMGSRFVIAQRSLMNVHSWAYQLQNIDIAQIADNSTFELVVMDYSADGSDDGKFSQEDILQIKNSGKKAICYISIGEAEDYRFYWDPSWDSDGNGLPDPGAPAWLGQENPDWEGNYKVRFWQTDWQEIIFSYIDTVVAQGFDGIYMDIIDAYYYWSEENGENPFADMAMILFVQNIRDHITGLITDEFYLIPQNGEFLIEEAHVSDILKNGYLDVIDGIGVEDVFFIGIEDNINPHDPDQERIDMILKYLASGKRVFSVEYLTDPDLIQQYVTVCGQQNFIPYATTRDLDVLKDGIITSIEDSSIYPESIHLYPNFPNPFNGMTEISYQLSAAGKVKLSVMNHVGQKVRTLVDGEKSAGRYSVVWDGRNDAGQDVATGLYLYRLQAGTFHRIGKAMLIR